MTKQSPALRCYFTAGCEREVQSLSLLACFQALRLSWKGLKMALVANPAPVEQQYHRKSTPSPTGFIQDEFYEETRDLLTACVECGFGKEETDVRISEERRYIVKLVIQTVKADEVYFRKLCEDLELTAANLFTKLMDVWNGMFTDGRISNGRLVALLSFCQYVTVYCRSVGLPSIESSVPHWAAFFIATQLKDWIVGRGGWVSSRMETCNIFHFLFVLFSLSHSSFYIGCTI